MAPRLVMARRGSSVAVGNGGGDLWSAHEFSAFGDDHLWSASGGEAAAAHSVQMQQLIASADLFDTDAQTATLRAATQQNGNTSASGSAGAAGAAGVWGGIAAGSTAAAQESADYLELVRWLGVGAADVKDEHEGEGAVKAEEEEEEEHRLHGKHIFALRNDIEANAASIGMAPSASTESLLSTSCSFSGSNDDDFSDASSGSEDSEPSSGVNVKAAKKNTAPRFQSICKACHERTTYCKGLCRRCYDTQPAMQTLTRLRQQRYNRSPKGIERIRRSKARRLLVVIDNSGVGGHDADGVEGLAALWSGH